MHHSLLGNLTFPRLLLLQAALLVLLRSQTPHGLTGDPSYSHEVQRRVLSELTLEVRLASERAPTPEHVFLELTVQNIGSELFRYSDSGTHEENFEYAVYRRGALMTMTADGQRRHRFTAINGGSHLAVRLQPGMERRYAVDLAALYPLVAGETHTVVIWRNFLDRTRARLDIVLAPPLTFSMQP